MKIKEIFNLCKPGKSIWVYSKSGSEGDGQVYLGTGCAMYPAFGLPPVTAGSLLTIFDVPSKQQEDWNVFFATPPQGISLVDNAVGEEHVTSLGIEIVRHGSDIKSLATPQGLVTFDKKYLAPLRDETNENFEYYIRYSDPEHKTAPIIVVKVGLMLRAVIVRKDLLDASFVDDFREYNRQVMHANSHKNADDINSALNYFFKEDDKNAE